MKSAADVPPGVPFESLIDSGLDSVEHSFYLVKAANPEVASLSIKASHALVTEADREWAEQMGVSLEAIMPVTHHLLGLAAAEGVTILASNWFGLFEQSGRIGAGANADLVILNANPLEEISNT
jgi:imidazolonepropionase-like amidohydrolase